MKYLLRTKAALSRLNFALGNKPQVVYYPHRTISKSIPQPYKAVVLFSCDFELTWAWRFAQFLHCNIKEAEAIAKRERENVDWILLLCEKFNVPMTWATVGHLFLESCSRKDGRVHTDLISPKHFKNQYWKFLSGEWFDQDPCCNWQDATAWYAPDLVEKIIRSSVKHEIACHTFSHIDCREKVCSAEMLRKEVKKCKESAHSFGVELKSFVFPGNFIGHRSVLKEEGITSYRIDKDVLAFPRRDSYGLWQCPTTAEIGLSCHGWKADYYIKKYTTIVERAIKHRRLCHFWFHPSSDGLFLKEVLSGLFSFISMNRKELYVTTMSDYIKFIETKITG
ncbi:MAG: polysaccharide deacetylase [Candidatus Omnitrophota bacterium]